MRRVLALFLVPLTLAACGDSPATPEPPAGPRIANLPIALSAAPSVATLVVEVTAPDLAEALVFNLTLSGGTASDTLAIPAGSNRRIVVRGYDATAIETHRGEVTTNLTEGSNAAVTIRLDPLIGDQPIIVVIGEVIVTVTPVADTVPEGDTVRLSGVVTNAAGDTVDVEPVWASLSPAVATVDESGLVTGVSVGEARIVASYGGVASSATVVVDPSVFPTNGLVHHFPFNGDANDQAGGGADGTVLGAVLEADRFGTANAAYRFDGVDDRIDLASPFFGAATNVASLSYSAWIFLDQIPAAGTGFPISDTDGFWRHKVVHVLDDASFRFGGSNPSPDGYFGIKSPAGTLAPSTWTHLAVTYEAGTVRLYINGTEVASELITYADLDYSALPGGNSVGNNIIGAFIPLTGATSHFDGVIDDLALWNRALLPAEVAWLAAN